MKIKIGEKEYTLNNNSNKLDRAKLVAGKNASPEIILAFYDHLLGLILDEKGDKVENGIFWEMYERKKEEQPEYIKTIEKRDRNLEEGEKRTIELMLKNIDHKRAFIGNAMSIAAIVIAGMFIILVSKDYGKCFNLLAKIDGSLFVIFLISSSIYLTHILSEESISLDKDLKFVRESRINFIENIGVTITDMDSYEKFRDEQYKKEKSIKGKISGDSEFWFKSIMYFFVSCCLLLLTMVLFV